MIVDGKRIWKEAVVASFQAMTPSSTYFSDSLSFYDRISY
jgi:hypothetical protein